MSLTYALVTLLTVAANAGIAAADFARARFVLANSAEVGVSERWIPWLAALKAAGAAGLLLGLLGARLIGLAAAVGLVLFFVGAVAAHIRTRVLHNIAFPTLFLALATGSLALAATR